MRALRSDEARAALAAALGAGDIASAERTWRSLAEADPEAPRVWPDGVALAGWRGDRAAVAEREAAGSAALEAAGDWRDRFALSLAAGEAHLCLADLRGALPRLGRALGQTEWHPDDPAAVHALLAVAQVHALHTAPRKALEQVARALDRPAARTPRAAASAHANAARWVRLVASLRLGRLTRVAAARRTDRLAQRAHGAGERPLAVRLAAEAAVVRGDAYALEHALARADALDLAGVRGRVTLLAQALQRAPR